MTRAPGRSRTVTTTTTTTTTTKRPSKRPGDTRGTRANPSDRAPRGVTAPVRTGGEPDTPPTDQPGFSSVKLRVHEIRCVTTTKEIDRDEIVLAAVKVEGTIGGTKERRQLAARARRGEQLSAGKFAKGDTQTYPKTRVLATYDAGGPIGPDPRYFLGAILVVEKDEGRLDEVIDSTVEAVERQVVTAISTTAATASGAALAGVTAGAAAGSVVPLVGSAIGAAAGAAVGLAFGQIKASRADDVFPLKKVELELAEFPEQPGEIPGSRQTLTFKGFKGHYEVTISWAVR